ncbi:uncharacterized protein LOC143553820 [Bidens hawaiensis]|uniref:uncharacterized protein LOC143553820 n=1 Tax=Bidens hawaiensis TaxID=980011 RepID=UPI0040496AA7
MDKHKEDDDKRVEWLHSEPYAADGNIFGEPQKTTRIGDEYQAQIPSLITKTKNDVDRFRFGLSNPVNMAPVPCSLNEKPWSAIEHDGFVFGLYVFGKNFRVVNKFVGNKGMPNVMSYYYGKFYRSSEHQKWSVYKKKRGRKPIPGKRIFCGWRRHELLSRLLPKVTDECKNSLTQVVRAFDEGKLSFEKYVFALRDTVGMNLLIESIAMGKGKQDLISKTRRTLRNKKFQFTQASLKTEQIVDSLKDIIGLSKARLHNLFWEVVWPRLLERGWHSEQPKSYIFHNSKNPLVFLAPGVTKFSRRSLEKGSQYFDSMTDVLNKVASEPHLLEDEPLPVQLVDPRVKQRPDDEQDLMKYTIVDTSLVRPVTVISEPADMQASTSVSEETEHDTTEESQNEDANHDTLEDKDSPVCEMNNPEPVRKLKLVFKHKPKHQQINNIRINSTSDDDEKKRTRTVMDSSNPRVGPDTDGDKQSDLTETTENNQTELLSAGTNGQRQSRRSRVLTTKALEALANGFLTPKKRRGGLEDGTRRRVRGKTALVSSCGAPCINDLGDGVFSGSSHMVSDS